MMNASIFEDTVGKSLVSLYAENIFMSYQGRRSLDNGCREGKKKAAYHRYI